MSNASKPKCKIYRRAFFKLIALRDHKDDEVALFGLSHPEDLLTIIDFHLPKQKVNTVSADIDTDWVPQHEMDMLVNHNIDPIRCTRFWTHTHPMTGKGSANPSAKDMSTWDDPDNAQKNFFVMMIVSKSDEITCKVRVRADCEGPISKVAPGLYASFDYDVEVVDDPEDSFPELLETFGQFAYEKFGPELCFKHLSPEEKMDLFPGLAELYKERVSKDVSHIQPYRQLPYKGGSNSSTPHTGIRKNLSYANAWKALSEFGDKNTRFFKDLSQTQMAKMRNSYIFTKKDIDELDQFMGVVENCPSDFLSGIMKSDMFDLDGTIRIDMRYKQYYRSRDFFCQSACMSVPEVLEMEKTLLNKKGAANV